MNLTSVELHPDGSTDVCVLSFRDPRRQNPYNVKAIIGLDVDQLIPRYYEGSESLAKFYQLMMEKRTLVVRISLNPDYTENDTFSSLRDKLYRFISSSRTGLLQVQFKNGSTVVAVISGFITKLEAPHFEKEQEVQLTIDCNEPMLRAPESVSVNVGEMSPVLTTIVDNLSTAPHGFDFDLSFTADVPQIVITDPDDSNWHFTVTPSGGFLWGDVLHFSSEFNNKELYILRGGYPPPGTSETRIYVGDKIDTGSVWPILFPRENKLTVSNGIHMVWNFITHRPAYWGV